MLVENGVLLELTGQSFTSIAIDDIVNTTCHVHTDYRQVHHAFMLIRSVQITR